MQFKILQKTFKATFFYEQKYEHDLLIFYEHENYCYTLSNMLSSKQISI